MKLFRSSIHTLLLVSLLLLLLLPTQGRFMDTFLPKPPVKIKVCPTPSWMAVLKLWSASFWNNGSSSPSGGTPGGKRRELTTIAYKPWSWSSSSSSSTSTCDDNTPVVCGDNECPYDSACLAERAGFDTEQDCSFQCPQPPTGVSTVCYSPQAVICGECEYDNLCQAKAAHFDTTTECRPVGEGELSYCRLPNPLVKCGSVGTSGKVVCDDRCEFDNPCLARSAGYNFDTECFFRSQDDDWCPKARTNAICPMIYKPVVCEEQQCEFQNDCLAASAGYDVDQECQTKLCFKPKPHYSNKMLPPPCEIDYSNAIICDGICEFHGTCAVYRAGFDINRDCVYANGKK